MSTPTERGLVSFTLGGQKRAAKVTIDLALEIEAATGKGVMALMREYLDATARLAQTIEILRLALKSNGQVYTTDEVQGMIGLDELVLATAHAGAIIGAIMAGGSKKKPSPKTAEANGRATISQ